MKKEEWTSYGEVYNAIVAAVIHGYAGARESKPYQDPHAASKVSLFHSRHFHGDDGEFLRLVRWYLGVLGDPNLSLDKAGEDPLRDWQPGFSVRAGENCLYVTECREETRLSPGSRILRVGGQPLSYFRKGMQKRMLYGDTPERENWSYFLRYADSLDVGEKGGVVRIKPGHFPVKQPSPVIEWRRLSETRGYLRLDSFQEGEKIKALAAEHDGELRECRELILDLRKCRGGDLDNLLPILPFMGREPLTVQELYGEQAFYLNCSRRNMVRMAAETELFAEQCGDSDLKEMFLQEAERLRSLAGKGFCRETTEFPESFSEKIPSAGENGDRELLLLTDTETCREAELLVKSRKGKPGCFVVGRATLGDTDYRERITISFENDLFFTYPAGKSLDAMEGRGILGKGIEPDLYVPWTPEEIREDLVLRAACRES